MTYLDYSATTKVDEEVLKTFIFYLLHELLCGFGVC